jgi:hypothetical protein
MVAALPVKKSREGSSLAAMKIYAKQAEQRPPTTKAYWQSFDNRIIDQFPKQACSYQL